MKQQRDAKGRFLPKPFDEKLHKDIKEKMLAFHTQENFDTFAYNELLKEVSIKPRVFTEQDIINAFMAGIADSGRGFLLPSKKAELYLRNLK